MKNLPRDLLASWCTVLLVSTVACTKANFVLPTDAGTSGGVGGTAGSGGAIGSEPDASMTCDAAGVPGCVPDPTGICDPVCQTGGCNWCSGLEKCTYAFDGVMSQPTCASLGQDQKATFDFCSVTSAGLPTQADNCAPGSICLTPVSGGTTSNCFSLCRSQDDCPSGVACAPRSLFPQPASINLVTVHVCDPPYDECVPDGKCCDPFGGAGAGSSCAANRFCYLVSPAPPPSGHSRTVCDFNTGDGFNASGCNSSRDCRQAYVCANGGCRRVCSLANPCPNNGKCTASGSEYGYCPY